MQRAAVFLAIAAILAAPATVLGVEPFSATLSAEREVPAPTVPSDYAGTGVAAVTINNDTSISYEFEFEGLTGPLVMAHIHWGAPGEAGPPIFWLTEQGVEDTSSPFGGLLTEEDFLPAEGGPQTFAEAQQAIRDGDTYVNLHTEANMSGEIRGQLKELPDTATTGSDFANRSTDPSVPAILFALFGFAILVIGLRWFRLSRV